MAEMMTLATELRRVCGHDSRSVDGCLHCEAADALEAARRTQPAQAVDVGEVSLDGTDAEVLCEFTRLCRETKPVGRWPGERVCTAIDRLMANQKPFRFIAEADRSLERDHNGRGGDCDPVFSGPRHATRAIGNAQAEGWRPIETAPKDGTRVWATDGDLYFAMHFDERYSWMHDAPLVAKPTHWQPLPTPPQPEE
jgi:hypothetical protein